MVLSIVIVLRREQSGDIEHARMRMSQAWSVPFSLILQFHHQNFFVRRSHCFVLKNSNHTAESGMRQYILCSVFSLNLIYSSSIPMMHSIQHTPYRESHYHHHGRLHRTLDPRSLERDYGRRHPTPRSTKTKLPRHHSTTRDLAATSSAA